MVTPGDIAPQLAVNDTNFLLASILLELRTMNLLIISQNGTKDEVADIRNSLVLADFTNQSS